MLWARGLLFTPATGREGEAQGAPRLSETLRKPRRGRSGPRGDVEETFLKGKRCTVSLSRAIDRDGTLVAVLLSEKRDKAVAEALSRSARTVLNGCRSGSPMMATPPLPVRATPR